MKILYRIFFLFCLNASAIVNAQNDSIDADYLSKQYLKGDFTIDKYQKLAKTWRDAIASVNGYPILPYKSDIQDIKYEYYFTFDSLDKNIIYNRILEFMSLKYANLASVIDYQDYDLGKIIIKARNPIKAHRSNRLYYLTNYRFTLIENRMKLEISQLSFDYEYNSYTMGETTFYNYLINEPVRKYYPITKNDSEYWQEYMQILKATKDDIESTAAKIEAFIQDINEDYNF
jgi:hypothetical protein